MNVYREKEDLIQGAKTIAEAIKDIHPKEHFLHRLAANWLYAYERMKQKESA